MGVVCCRWGVMVDGWVVDFGMGFVSLLGFDVLGLV